MDSPQINVAVNQLTFSLFQRPLHPELFQLYADRRLKTDKYEAMIWVTGCTHVVTVFSGDVCLSEVVSTPGQLLPIFGANSARLLFAGDTIPTVAHLRLGWVMAYDVLPLTTIAEKEAIYRRCYDEGIFLAFPHDPQVGGVAIDGTIERPVVARTLSL